MRIGAGGQSVNYVRNTRTPLRLATLSLLALLAAGCASSKPKGASTSIPDVGPMFHFMAPGSTNSVVVPTNCKYGVWTTDRGLLSLQGIF